METLADLSKLNSHRIPEKEVGILASKTPTWSGCVNASHITLCAGELMGQTVKMSQMPIIAGGRPVEIEGKKGFYYKPSREQRAFERWQKGQFEEIERIMAKEWRDVVLKSPQISPLKNELRFSNLDNIRSFTKEILSTPQYKWIAFNEGINTAGFSQQQMWKAIKLWCYAGLPSIAEYTPYIHYLAEVNSFFSTAILTGHISADRASNKIDSAYLYYLPFTQIFISSDKLHARMVPHFLGVSQKFIWGPNLKNDLKRLVEIFKQHPNIEKLGLIKVAASPPKEDKGLIAQLYDSFLPSWRLRSEVPAETVNENPELHAKIMKQVKEMESAARRPIKNLLSKDFDHESIEMMTIERHVSLRRGDWQFLPANIKE